MVRLCARCNTERAALKRPKTLEQICRQCFFDVFEAEVHDTITSCRLFKPGERVAIGASGGKDSTVLAHVLTTLNRRHGYGLDLFLLSIDEGIAGYRDDSLETVKRNEQQYKVPLKILSYKELYGWTMDEIVRQIGSRNNCTFCGVFRRQALDRGAVLLAAHKVATGHNADDIAETVLLNILRGDVPRLGRCTSAITGEDGALPRVKPFKYTYEKEIVMYAYFKKLDYFSTECVYAPFAARGAAREFIKDVEACRPSAILDIIRSGEQFRFRHEAAPAGGASSSSSGSAGAAAAAPPPPPPPRTCERCGYISSQPVCKACVLLEGLNKGLPRMGVARTRNGRPERDAAAAPAARQPEAKQQQQQEEEEGKGAVKAAHQDASGAVGTSAGQHQQQGSEAAAPAAAGCGRPGCCNSAASGCSVLGELTAGDASSAAEGSGEAAASSSSSGAGGLQQLPTLLGGGDGEAGGSSSAAAAGRSGASPALATAPARTPIRISYDQ